jgi:hypothetical protein
MPQASPFDAILKESRDLISERLGDAVTGMLDKADEALAALVDKTQDKDQQGYLLATRDVVARQRSAIQEEFGTRYLEEFSRRVREVRKALGTATADDEAPLEMELELVGEDDLEETLRFNDMAARLRRMCEDELGALDQRAGVLLGDANLQSEDNPFGSQAVCAAYKQVCKAVETDVKVRRVMLKLFDDHVADAMRAIYKEVNALLVDNSILPKIRYAVVKKEGGAAGGGADGGEAEEGDVEDAVETKVKKATEAATAAGQDIFSILQKLMGGGAATAPGGGPMPGTPGGPPALQGTELMGSLTRLQHGDAGVITSGAVAIPAGGGVTTNVLHDLKASNVGASMGQMDAMTLDIVSMLFDQLFDDPKVPAGVKALVARLQIPILKVAIADKTIFSKKDHPAREMLDILGDFAGRLPADFDKEHPTYPKLEAMLHQLIEGYEDKIDIFVATNEKLRALVGEEEQRAAREADVASRQVAQRENLALAGNDARTEVKARMQEGKAPRPVIAFLARHWIKFLVLVHVQSGRSSDAWKGAIETMDQLIWSVQPKADPAERKKLGTTVPSLLKKITAGATAAGIEDTERAAFFAELMKLHTAVLHNAAEQMEKAKAAAALADAAAAKALAKDAKAAKAAGTKPAGTKPAQAAEELDFTAPIAVKIGNEVVQVEKGDELDFTEAQAAEAAPAPAPTAGAPAGASAGAKPVAPREIPKEVKLPSKLKEGVWIGIRSQDLDAPRQPAKLLYVSPLKSRFLFCDRRGKTVLECTRSDLAKRFRMRDVVILSESPDASLFERIINGVLGKLGHA